MLWIDYVKHYFPHGKLRCGIEYLISRIEKCVNETKPFVIISTLPTGYGKSTLTLLLGSIIERSGFNEMFERIIHCIPTRLLVENLTIDARQRFGIEAYGQCMTIDPLIKSPAFLPSLVFTTYDSYVFNFFKLPLPEISRIIQKSKFGYIGHYEIPRYAIYSALNIFDEYHLFTPGDSGDYDERLEYRAWVTLSRIVIQLLRSGAPIILETATAIDSVINYLKDLVNMYRLSRMENLFIKYDAKSKSGISEYGNEVIVNDEDYTNAAINNVCIHTRLEKKPIISAVREHLINRKASGKILIVCNNIRDAVKIYDEVSQHYDTALLHSKFTVEHREKIINELNKREVVVSTQAIEVGVNYDSDILITEIAPITCLIQRAGRLCRDFEKRQREGLMVITYESNKFKNNTYAGIYNADVVMRTITELESELLKGNMIDWKLPFHDNRKSNGKTYISYLDVARKVYALHDISKFVHDKEYYRFNLQLRAIDEAVLLDSRHAEMFLERICMIMKNDITIPLYIPKSDNLSREIEELKSYRDLIQRCVPVELWRLEKDILHVEDGKVKCIVEIEDHFYLHESERLYEMIKRIQTKEEYSCNLISFVERVGDNWYSLVALVAKQNTYDEVRGLKVW